VYDYPINMAAQKLGVGVTVLKKYCRKFQIPRWPYRKLKSMEKLIESVNEYAAQDPVMTQVRPPAGRLPRDHPPHCTSCMPHCSGLSSALSLRALPLATGHHFNRYCHHTTLCTYNQT
jgi:hypothetical protein